MERYGQRLEVGCQKREQLVNSEEGRRQERGSKDSRGGEGEGEKRERENFEGKRGEKE